MQQLESLDTARQLTQDLFFKRISIDQSSSGSKLRNVIQQNPQKNEAAKVFEINGELTFEKKTISNKFCMFFATIGRRLQNTLPALVNQIWKHHEHPTLDHTQNPKKSTFNCTKDIRDILTKLKRKKAAGYEDIPTSLIVDGANEIAGPLSNLIN